MCHRVWAFAYELSFERMGADLEVERVAIVT